MTKQLRLHGFGDINNLKLDEVSLEKPLKNEVKIKVKASALNRDQLYYIQKGEYGKATEQSISRMGYEGSGVVVEVGDNVDESWLRKAVFPVGAFDVVRYGTMGEEAIVPAHRLVEKPTNLSFVEATAVWVPFITAYGIISDGKLSHGETVLITAASSAVAMAAIEIAQSIGAIPIASVRSADNVAKLETLGVKNIILDNSSTYEEEIMNMTNGKGVNVVFDSIGGSFLDKMARVASVEGRIVEYGVLGGFEASFPTIEVLKKNLTITGFTMEKIFRNEEVFETAKQFILKGIEKKTFKPKVSSIFPFYEYKKAFETLQKSRELGRIVLEMN